QYYANVYIVLQNKNVMTNTLAAPGEQQSAEFYYRAPELDYKKLSYRRGLVGNDSVDFIKPTVLDPILSGQDVCKWLGFDTGDLELMAVVELPMPLAYAGMKEYDEPPEPVFCFRSAGSKNAHAKDADTTYYIMGQK